MDTSSSGRILVGVDEDLASMRAVEIGAQLAHILACQLDLLTVLDLSQIDVFDDFYRTESALVFKLERERIALLQTAVHRLGDRAPPYRARLRHGDTRHILREEATQPDLRILVLGKSDKSASERILLGSVSRAVLRKCPVPLLLVDSIEA